MRRGILVVAMAACAVVSSVSGASAADCGSCFGCGCGLRGLFQVGGCRPRLHRVGADFSQTDATWHGNYFHQQWGTPVAMVVPPTVGAQTIWSRGVGGTRVVPIYSQFTKGGAGPVQPRGFAAQPMWPYSTDEFGVHNVRGPW